MENPLDLVQELAHQTGGHIEEVGILPDASGFAVVSMPLPKDHWLTKEPEAFNVPPMPLCMGKGNPLRKPLSAALREVGRYAVRCATDNGKIEDFDPDALVQCLITGMLGYNTPTGLSKDESANPVIPQG